MKIWIHIDGMQEGPFTVDTLPMDRIDASTPVWHAGLDDWVAAADSPALRHLFAPGAEAPQQPVTMAAPAPLPAPAPACASAETPAQAVPAQAPAAASPATGPATTYLLPTLIISVVTLNLVGIVPLIMGWGVRRRNRRQAYAKAASLSHCTAWWVMITIVVSLMIPFSMLI